MLYAKLLHGNGFLVLTLLRKPFSIDAAFTDKDLGILIGFSRITGERKTTDISFKLPALTSCLYHMLI